MTAPAGAPAPGRIVLAGFEPFDGDTINPSWEVAQALDGATVAGCIVQAVRLPCVFGAAPAALDAALAGMPAPTLVVALGLARGRAAITPERVAINVDDARIADNAGRRPIDEPVVRGGPAAYFSTLPIKAIVRALDAASVPASVSNSAGTFVCNHVFYGLMHRLATARGLQGARGGFIHVPWLPEQGAPSLTLPEMVDGLRAGIHAALTTDTDLRRGGGAIH